MPSTIRPADPTRDAAACAAIYAPFVRDSIITFEIEPPDAAEFSARITKAQMRHAWLVIEVDGGVVGYAHAGPHNPRAAYDRTATLGIYLAPAAQGRGLGVRLYSALIDALAAKGFHALLGIITLPNPPSIALHEKLGFTQVGHFREVGWKQGRWLDTSWWEKLI